MSEEIRKEDTRRRAFHDQLVVAMAPVMLERLLKRTEEGDPNSRASLLAGIATVNDVADCFLSCRDSHKLPE